MRGMRGTRGKRAFGDILSLKRKYAKKLPNILGSNKGEVTLKFDLSNFSLLR